MSKALLIPDAVNLDENAAEVIRAWVASGQLHISIAAGLWQDPAAWGIVLVDLARHVARSYEVAANISYEQALTRIKAGFVAEWDSSAE